MLLAFVSAPLASQNVRATAVKHLDESRQEVRSLVVLGMRPDLLPDEVAFIRNLERSARAEGKLLSKALQHVKEWQKQTCRGLFRWFLRSVPFIHSQSVA